MNMEPEKVALNKLDLSSWKTLDMKHVVGT